MDAAESRRPDAPLTCPWPIIAVLLGAVLILSFLARGPGTFRIDARTTSFVQDLDGPLFSALAAVGNAIGYSLIAVPLWAVATIASIALKRRRELAFLIAVLILRGGATILKGLFDSPRPTAEVAELVGTHEGLGFPSGHSVTAAVAVGGIAFLTLRVASWRDAWMIAALAFMACVTLTAFARIWVGAHWLTDTIGGTLVGTTIVLVSANLSAIIDDAGWPSVFGRR
jgi:undecaprenyl-diphosphatase